MHELMRWPRISSRWGPLQWYHSYLCRSTLGRWPTRFRPWCGQGRPPARTGCSRRAAAPPCRRGKRSGRTSLRAAAASAARLWGGLAAGRGLQASQLAGGRVGRWAARRGVLLPRLLACERPLRCAGLSMACAPSSAALLLAPLGTKPDMRTLPGLLPSHGTLNPKPKPWPRRGLTADGVGRGRALRRVRGIVLFAAAEHAVTGEAVLGPASSSENSPGTVRSQKAVGRLTGAARRGRTGCMRGHRNPAGRP